MSDHKDLLKEKAMLLIARERELLALRKAHDRLGAWLHLAQQLPELVPATLEIAPICEGLRKRLISLLNLQVVAFFEILPGSTLRSILPVSAAEASTARELGPEARELVFGQSSGVCNEPRTQGEAVFAAAVGLHRFVWFRIERHAEDPLLIAAGFDRERAAFNQRFAESDVAHFQQTGRELELLLGNTSLLKRLAREREALRVANEELEHRVEERTRELAVVNEGLAATLEALQAREALLAADIDQAREFQQILLPALPTSDGIEFASVYRPLEQVGGDVFDIWERAPGSFRVFIADATGHGVQAAMRTIWLKAEYDRLKTVESGPHTLLTTLAGRLSELFSTGDMMCTGLCLDLQLCPDGARVSYASAAHPPLLRWSNAGLEEIYQQGSYLGLGRAEWPSALEFRLAPGDFLLAYSDGLVEQVNAAREPFEDVLRGMSNHAPESAERQLASVLQLFDAFRGDTPLRDDVSAVAVTIPGTPFRP